MALLDSISDYIRPYTFLDSAAVVVTFKVIHMPPWLSQHFIISIKFNSLKTLQLLGSLFDQEPKFAVIVNETPYYANQL